MAPFEKNYGLFDMTTAPFYCLIPEQLITYAAAHYFGTISFSCRWFLVLNPTSYHSIMACLSILDFHLDRTLYERCDLLGGNVGPTVLRFEKIEHFLVGEPLTLKGVFDEYDSGIR